MAHDEAGLESSGPKAKPATSEPKHPAVAAAGAHPAQPRSQSANTETAIARHKFAKGDRMHGDVDARAAVPGLICEPATSTSQNSKSLAQRGRAGEVPLGMREAFNVGSSLTRLRSLER